MTERAVRLQTLQLLKSIEKRLARLEGHFEIEAPADEPSPAQAGGPVECVATEEDAGSDSEEESEATPGAGAEARASGRPPRTPRGSR